MAQNIKFGTTKFEQLPALLKLSEEELQSKKARLFPNGNSEHETTIVSIFLASLGAVKEYREKLLFEIGVNKIKAKNANIHMYVEIQDGNKQNRPDGLIVITSGKNPVIEWAGIIEAKIGTHELNKEQIENYADFASELGITDIITISNQLSTTPLDSPIKLRRTKFNLYHWSWTYLKVVAHRLVMTKGVEDEDHIYILNELGRFFNDNKSLKNFTNMGDNWKDSAAEIHSYPEQQKLKTETLNTITSAYIQEEKDNSLQMTHKTKHHVELFTKGDRAEELAQMLNSKKIVTSKYFVDNNKNNAFEIEVDFKGLSIKCSTKIEITKGKAQAQTTALLKLLENNAGYMEGIYINAFYQRNKSTSTAGASLSELLDERNDITNTQYKILDKNLGDTIKYFEIYTKDIIGKRFHGNKTFIDDLESFSERFLNQVIAYIY